MAISNIQTIQAEPGLSASLPITDGSGNDRIAIMLGLQRRSTLNLANLTLDSASPTGAIATVDNSNLRVIGAYWLDADMPATGGSYTVAMTGPDTAACLGALSCSGAAQQSPTDIQTDINGGVAGPAPTFSISAAAGSVCVVGLSMASTPTVTSNSNQTIIVDPSTTLRQAMDYDTTDTSIGYSFSFDSLFAALAFAIEPAGGGGGGSSVPAGSLSLLGAGI